MKKRILSLILLVATLITAIPVMAVTAADTVAEAAHDLSALYIGAENGPAPSVEGGKLRALYTAFAGETGTYDIAAGKWFNKVSGEDAALYDNHAEVSFASGEKGGISITGVTRTNYNALPTDFGIKLSDAYAELSAFTVESVAMLTPFAYKNADGTDYTTNSDADNQNFRFGALSCDFWINMNCSVRARMNWRNIPIGSVEGGEYHWNGQPDDTIRKNYEDEYNVFAGLNRVVTMVTNADKSKTYGVYYDNTEVVLNAVLAKATITEEQYNKTIEAEKKKLGSFYLFAGTPGDVYAIRVYDYALTAEERRYNHLIDLLSFYEVAIPADATAGSLWRVSAIASGMKFVYGDDGLGQNYTMNRSLLEAAVTHGNNGVDYSALYLGADGSKTANGASLVGLYTAFRNEIGTDAYDLTAKKWKNKMDGTGATDGVLIDNHGTLNWRETPEGNGGLTMNYRTVDASDWATANIDKSGITLNNGWEAFADFTVETLAVGHRVTGGANSSLLPSGTSTQRTFRFDLYSSYYAPNLGTDQGVPLYLMTRAAQCTLWYCSGGVHSGRHTPFLQATCGGTTASEAKYAPAGLTMAITKDTTVTNAETQEGTVTFASIYNNASAKVCQGEYSLANYNTAKTSATRTFSLYHQTPMDAYAIRVYNGILTTAELKYNHLIDLFGFYQIVLPVGLTAARAQEEFASMASTYYAVTFVYDNESARSANDYGTVKKALQDAVDVLFPRADKTEYDELYVQEGLVGLSTAFGDDVSYSLTDKKWANKVEPGAPITLRSDSTNPWGAGTLGKGGVALKNLKANYAAVSTTGLNVPKEWAALENFTLETTQIAYGVGNGSESAVDNGESKHMVIDLVHFHYMTNVDAKEVLSGGGTWHANTTNAWHTGGRDKTWRQLMCENGGDWKTSPYKVGDPVGTTLWLTKTTTHTGTGDAATYSVTYAVDHNRRAEEQGIISGATYDQAAYETALAAGTRGFRLFSGIPADIYAIRVYNRVLTDAEKQYNHMVDLLAFYEIEVEGLDRELISTIAPLYYGTTFVVDNNGKADDYDKVKAAIEASLKDGSGKTAYDELYVAQENLVGLYTAFGNDYLTELSLAQANWLNKVGSDYAILYDNTTYVNWQIAGTRGGFTLGIDSQSKWEKTTLLGAGIRLNEAWASLANFTVETTSVAVGAYMPSNKYASDKVTITSTTGGQTIYSSNGPGFEETFCLDMISSACYFNLYSNNGLGMGLITRMEGKCTSPWYAMEGRSEAYRSLLKNVNKSTDDDYGAIPAGLTLIYTKNTTDTGVTFTASVNTGTVVNIDAGTKCAGSYTYTKDDYASAVKNATITTGHKFSLYNRGMYDVYAIRVYNKVLTESEKQFNHLIDLLAFYGVEIPDGIGAAQLAPLAAKYATTAFVYGRGGSTAYREDLI